MSRRYRPIRPSVVVKPIRKAIDARKVTSDKGRVNGWDGFVATVDGAVATIAAKVTLVVAAACGFTVELLDSSSDYVLPVLDKIPKEGKPVIFSLAIGLSAGLFVLARRRKKGSTNKQEEGKS